MESDQLRLGELMRRLWPFFAVLAVFWVVSGYWWGTMGYRDTFAWMNQVRYWSLDQTALYVFTHFADGLILPGIVFLLFWRRDPVLAITALLAILITGAITQTGKLFIFTDWHRPPVVFEGVQGISIVHPHPPHSRSFPSGHSTSAATGGLFFALLLSQWRIWTGFLVGLFTIFIGLTRVVIGVHFPGDVFIGSIIGSVGGLLVLMALYPLLAKRLHRLRDAQSGRVALFVSGVAVLIIVGQMVHLIWVT